LIRHAIGGLRGRSGQRRSHERGQNEQYSRHSSSFL
jgi:hypothetical protein